MGQLGVWFKKSSGRKEALCSQKCDGEGQGAGATLPKLPGPGEGRVGLGPPSSGLVGVAAGPGTQHRAGTAMVLQVNPPLDLIF